ncbi:MAG: RHS repeat-associated core domain-containing protein [Cellulomonadaceae bacterium]|nr:RHS repeat-associated core domain-containing protein [Cellulomonadaceae bacterium]
MASLGGAAPYWTDYTYDAAANRTATTSHAGTGDTTATYVYPATGSAQPHAVTSVTASGPAGVSTSSFGYDAIGNTTSRQVAGQAAQSVVWDAEGKLASVTAAGSTLESNLYAADGSRIIRRAGTKVTAYLPGGQELTLDTATGTLSGLRYYSFAGRTIAVRNGPGLPAVTTLIPDSQGTALASIANSTDALTRRYADPFGAPRGTAATAWVGDHGFLDKATDAVTGLTQVGARYLDTTLGRFISVDPLMDLTDPQQWNAYAYSNNNPTTWSDPTGLAPMTGDWARGPSRYTPSRPVSVLSWLNGYRKGVWGVAADTVRGIWAKNPGSQMFTLATNPSRYWQQNGGALVDWVRRQDSWSGARSSAGAQWNGWWATTKRPWLTGDSLGQAEQIGTGVGTVTLALLPIGEAGAAARLAAGARTGEGIAAGTVAADTAGLEARASALQGVLDPIARNSRTAAALGTREGQTVLAGGGRDLSPLQRALVQEGEILAREPGAHAEVTAMNGARSAGLTPQGIGASRPICPACQGFLEESGATMTSPTTAWWFGG